MRLLLGAVQPEPGMGLPRDISVDGGRIDAVLGQATAWVTLLFLVLVAAMLYAVVRHGRAHAASSEAGTSRRATLRTLGVALAIFGLIDGSLFVHAVRDVRQVFWNVDAVDALPNVVRIEINAHQWAWDVRYAGPDGLFNTADDIVGLNQVVVPAGAPVLVELAATDVIHSFYLPNLRVKRDAVPGRITTLTFNAREPGEYEIACAQLCGVNHYKMRGLLQVVSPAEFERWSAHETALAQRAYDAADSAAHWGWPWEARR